MKRFWKIAGVATLVAVLGAAVLGTAVFAQEGEGTDWPFDFGGKMHEAIASILGITVEEYDAALDQAHEQVLDQAVEEGWFTEEQAEQMRERRAEGPGKRGGFGEMKGPRGMGGRDGGLLEIAAEQLGLSMEELRTELQDGKSIADVAAEQGVDVQAIADAIVANTQEKLDQAVEDGKLTQERADWMLEQAEGRISEQLNNVWEGPLPGQRPGGFPGGKGPGRMGSPEQDTDSNLQS